MLRLTGRVKGVSVTGAGYFENSFANVAPSGATNSDLQDLRRERTMREADLSPSKHVAP